MKAWIEALNPLEQLVRTWGHFFPHSWSHFDRFMEVLNVSCFKFHFLLNLKPIEGCSEPVYRLLIGSHIKEYTFPLVCRIRKVGFPKSGSHRTLSWSQTSPELGLLKTAFPLMSLEIQHSFLIISRFHLSPGLFGRLLCGSVTPWSVSFRTNWKPRWGFMSCLHWALSAAVTWHRFFEFPLSSPI